MEVREAGAGPAVVLLHGCPSPISDFDPIVEALSPTRRVLCPVLPGYGTSAPHPAGYRLAEMTRLIVDELEARGVTEAGVLGYSYGAYRALGLALSGSLRVTELYLLSGVAGFDEEMLRTRSQIAASVRDPTFDLRALFLQMALPPGFSEAHPDAAARVGSWVELAPRAVIAAEVEASVLDDDLRPRLGEITVPAWLRVGALDGGAPPAWSEEIARRLPHATLEIVPGCGHALLVEDRELTTASVVSFFSN